MIWKSRFVLSLVLSFFAGVIAQDRPSVTVHSVGLADVSYVKNVELAVPAFDSTSFFFTGKWSVDFDSLQTWKKMYSFNLNKEDISVHFRVGSMTTFIVEEGFALDSLKKEDALVKSALDLKVKQMSSADSSFKAIKAPAYDKEVKAGFVEFTQAEKKGCLFMGLSAKRGVAFASATMNKAAADACQVLYKVWDRKEKIAKN